jgi:hypothetical protein
MMRVRLKHPVVEARRVTVESLDAVAEWMGGSVAGIRLPPVDRAVRFTNRDHEEHEANVGEWIVRFELADGRRRGMVLTPQEFEAMFAADRSGGVDGPQ